MNRPAGRSAILYPTTFAEAEKAKVEVRDPVAGGGRRQPEAGDPAPRNLYKLNNLMVGDRATLERMGPPPPPAVSWDRKILR